MNTENSKFYAITTHGFEGDWFEKVAGRAADDWAFDSREEAERVMHATYRGADDFGAEPTVEVVELIDLDVDEDGDVWGRRYVGGGLDLLPLFKAEVE